MRQALMTALLIIAVCTLTLPLGGCASKRLSPAVMSELQQGKRDFDAGYYRRAMRELLPLACDGNAEAQYAVGYMYYYGFGVGQDSDVGAFWIGRSAAQHYPPAEAAYGIISRGEANK